MADANTGFQQPDYVFNLINIPFRIQAVTAVGAFGVDQVMAFFPGPQRNRIDTGQVGYRADGKSLAFHAGYRFVLKGISMTIQNVYSEGNN